MPRTCRRRTFAQVRTEHDREIARYIDHHADKLDRSGQREAGAAVRALAGNIRAGLAT